MPLGWGLLGGAAGAGAAAGGFPWALLPIILSLAGSVFGQDEKSKNVDELYEMQSLLRQMGINPPYQSPYLKRMDPIIAQALAAQLKRTSNWGWPAGMGIDTSFLDTFLQNMGSGSLAGSLPGSIRKR